MPRINKYKIVNFRYGDKHSRLLSDRTITPLGNNVQMEATNTLGKSMSILALVQAICPLSDTGRKAIDVFTCKEPVYVAIEWLLDDDTTKLLTGIALERISTADEASVSKKDDLYRFFTFAIEECSDMNIDIDNLPFIKSNGPGGKDILNSTNDFEKFLVDLKKNFKGKVNIYKQTHGRINYRNKLSEYGINQGEWKDIILKLNKDEGMLSVMFEECNTTEKLLKKEILPLIDVNLNKNQIGDIRINQLKNEVKSFIEHCLANEEKINSQKDFSMLLKFIDDIYSNTMLLKENEDKIDELKKKLSSLYYYCENSKKELENKIELKKQEVDGIVLDLTQVDYEEDSYEYIKEVLEIKELNKLIVDIDCTIEDIEKEIIKNQVVDMKIDFQSKTNELSTNREVLAKYIAKKKKLSLANEELNSQINNLGYSIKINKENEIKNIKEKQNKYKNEYEILSKDNNNLNDELINLNKDKTKLSADIKFKEIELSELDKKMNLFISKNHIVEEYINDTLMGRNINFDKLNNDTLDKLKGANEVVSDINNRINELDDKKDSNEKLIIMLTEDKFKIQSNIKELSSKRNQLLKINDLIENTFKDLGIEVHLLNTADSIKKQINLKINQLNVEEEKLNAIKFNKINELNKVENSTDINIDPSLEAALKLLNIEFEFGFNYLIDLDYSFEKKIELINKCPLLPYSVIISEKDFEKLKKNKLECHINSTTPILIRETSNNIDLEISNNIVSSKFINLIASFDYMLLDENKRAEIVKNLNDKLEKINKNIEFIGTQKRKLIKVLSVITDDFDKDNINLYEDKINSYELEINDIEMRISNCNKDNIKIKEDKFNLNNEKDKAIGLINTLENFLSDIEVICNEQDKLSHHKEYIVLLKDKMQTTENDIKNIKEKVALISENLLDLKFNLEVLVKDEKEVNKILLEFKNYVDGSLINMDINDMINEFNELKKSSNANDILELDNLISIHKERINVLENELAVLKEKIDIEDVSMLINESIIETKEEINSKINSLNNKLNEKVSKKNKILKDKHKKEGSIETLSQKICNKYNKAPIEYQLIENFNFKERKKILKDNKKEISNIINKCKNQLNNMNGWIKLLAEYKLEKDDIYNYDNIDIQKFVDESKKSLKKISIEMLKLKDSQFEVCRNINKFNVENEGKYDYITEGLSLEISINSQLERISIIKLHLETELNNLAKETESLSIERNIISNLTKEYVKDIINQLRIIDKLGKLKEDKILNIRLPKEENIYYSKIDDMMEAISNDKNISNIEYMINSFYLLNTVVGISQIKIRVMKYELNNKKSMVDWERVSREKSGGQGFCIGFVLLSILMEYKRYNPKNLTNKFTGKVLIMDNPFAKVSNPGLLKVVFELAKKFKVQIISYTHIENQSVREPFDLIYTMKVVNKLQSNGEVVIIEQLKNDINELVNTSKYEINEREVQENLFDLIM